MKIEIPEKSLVIMVGATCSGKSTFCNMYFNKEDILESKEVGEGLELKMRKEMGLK